MWREKGGDRRVRKGTGRNEKLRKEKKMVREGAEGSFVRPRF